MRKQWLEPVCDVLHVSRRKRSGASDVSSLVNTADLGLQLVDSSGTDPYSAVCSVTAVRGKNVS